MTQNQSSLTIIYCSQTGQAQAIAESIYDLAANNQFEAQIHCISGYDKKFKLNELTNPVVFVCSTTGDGEVPETGFRCWNRLKRKDDSQFLNNLNYAILGLGDTNYTTFCGGPKSFHNKFQDLGGKCIYGPFWADDGTGLDIEVEPFKEGLWNALKSFLSKGQMTINDIENIVPVIDNSTEVTSQTIDVSFEEKLKQLSLVDTELTIPVLAENILSYTTSEPHNLLENTNEELRFYLNIATSTEIYEATVNSNNIVTDTSAAKTCYDLKFTPENLHVLNNDSLTKSSSPDFSYDPGDAISILCPNDSEEVKSLLKRLNVKSNDEVLSIKSTNPKKISGRKYVELTEKNMLSITNFFTYCVDIRHSSIKKGLLRMLANYCSDSSDEKRIFELCSKEGAEIFQSLVKEPMLSLLDLLNMFKSCNPPLDHLIQNLSPLVIRSYSLCSFYSESKKNELEVIFNIVDFDQSMGRTYSRKGIATGYLSKLKPGQKLFFFRRKFQGFTFPSDEELCDKPLVMIGPGTGIAPFISYLRSKAGHKESKSELVLFYGCRDPRKDFLFKSEVLNFSTNVLNKCYVSFSRVSNIDNYAETDIDTLKQVYQKEARYVQDSIRMNSKEICDLIHEKSAYVYICGDAANMSKDVLKCLTECLAQECNLSAEDSNKYLLDMMKNKRYKQDIWA